MCYFEWQHRLQRGRPVKRIFLSRPPEWPDWGAEIRYGSRRLCYRGRRRAEIQMLNLETGEISIWSDSNGFVGEESFFTLSDRYFVFFAVHE